ncbi:MAG TPA: GNAT family N-acetyltransferase [Sandaracinaceae bacterium]
MRPAHGGDADELARVHLESWRSVYRGLLPDWYLASLRQDELAARWWRRIAADEVDECIRVIDVAGKMAGFVTFGPQRDDPTWLGYAGEIYELYLRPELTGLGLGRALLERAFEELSRCRCHWVVVWVLAKNEGARSFYERQGMRLDGGRRWDPFGDRAVPVVRYAKALNPVVDFAELARQRKIGH